MTKNILAIDLGATSGRAILAACSETKIESMREVLRFPNQILQVSGKYYWNIWSIYEHVINALKTLASEGAEIDSIGVDTWGVDFVCVGEDGNFLELPRSYRDPYTDGIPEELFRIIPKDEVYKKTGTQILNINSLYQLYAQKKEGSSALKNAKKILFLPDAVSYLLTGKMVCESTILSTAQLRNLNTGKIDEELLAAAGISLSLFPEMVEPGTVVGTLTPEIQKQTGLGAIPVVAVAGHDTASAVAAIPAADEHFAYLSCGTWSLFGIETRKAIISDKSREYNCTNEGGVEGTTRFLKNICGMWLLECCRKQWGKSAPEIGQLCKDAMEAPAFQSLINPDDPSFANPESMVDAIQEYCRRSGQHVPEGYREISRCIFESLALRYRQVLGYMVELAPFRIDRLHVIGGGCRNAYLMQMTADSIGLPVLAGPVEGTAFGNIMLQAKAAGLVGDRFEMRKIIAGTIEMKEYQPHDSAPWDDAYDKFLKVTK